MYSVRDNGAVMRHKREGQRARKLDDVWTFGRKDNSNGYMMINSHRVHIIVATAFISGNEDGKMVVDHKDTNRCNNRVENLRWVTRLENVLLNEATLKKVSYLCGGDINKFLNDPSCLRDLSGDNQDIMWMRTVTTEEAKKAWEHISAWSKRPNSTYKMMKQKGQTVDFYEWLKHHNINGISTLPNGKDILTKLNEAKENKNVIFLSPERLENEQLEWEKEKLSAEEKIESLTKGALQIQFHERMYFPLCPEIDISGGLDTYANNLQIGEVIARNEQGDEYTIESLGWTWEWDAIQVEYKYNGYKASSCIHISIVDGFFLHSKGAYQPNYRFCDSPNVLQCGAIPQFHFPQCPTNGNVTLEEYARILQKGILFETGKYGNGYIYDREIIQSEDDTPILYVGTKIENPIKPYADTFVFIENGKVIHQLGKTIWDEKCLLRAFSKIRGQQWNDEEDVMDDYC